MKHIIAICLTLFCLSASAANLAQQADSAYNREAYADAIRLYNEAIATDGVSSNILYNLGNAYYRDNQLGKAILSYERALNLDPSNSEAAINLNFVRTRIEDAPEDDSSFLSNVHKSVVSTFSPDAWAWLALIIFIILLGTIAAYIFSNQVRVRKFGFFGAIVMLFVFLYVIVIAYQTAGAYKRHDTAVVIVPTTTLSSAPRSTRSDKEKVVPIHEGTKVEILDSLSTPDDPNVGKWYDVKINNSSRAWLNAADVERI